MAYYLEETKGALPLWLAPVQVNIIPVNNEYHLDYAKEIRNNLQELDVRVNLDSRDEKLSYKMRESQANKVPLTLNLGNKESEDKTISYRKFGSQDTTTVSIPEFNDYVDKLIKERKYNL